MQLIPNMEQSPSIRLCINIGAGLDIMTGDWYKGKHGENILNGGYGIITGIAAKGNQFKSTIQHYMSLAAFSSVLDVSPTSISTYDTESQKTEKRLATLAWRFPPIRKMGIDHLFMSKIWTVSDKSIYMANKWYDLTKEFMKAKRDNAKDIMLESPFLDRDGKTLIKAKTPTFSEIDSFTDFETDAEITLTDMNELGDSGRNVINMRGGLIKSMFLKEVSTLCPSSMHFMGMVAQLSKEHTMATGPIPKAPDKTLHYLKGDDKLSGVTRKFSYVTYNMWYAYNASPLINQSTKMPEYPRPGEGESRISTDLNVVMLRQLRGKNGPSGLVTELIVSQDEGVLPELTNFHIIKNANRFGLGGSVQNYYLELYPDCKLSRTTIRGKIDRDRKLRRALHITSEMCEMLQYMPLYRKELHCTPLQLYEDLKKLGFDWDFILTYTRGSWRFNEDKAPGLFLSTMDLLEMRAGIYYPYWMDKDKKVKKEYAHKVVKEEDDISIKNEMPSVQNT